MLAGISVVEALVKEKKRQSRRDSLVHSPLNTRVICFLTDVAQRLNAGKVYTALKVDLELINQFAVHFGDDDVREFSLFHVCAYQPDNQPCNFFTFLKGLKGPYFKEFCTQFQVKKHLDKSTIKDLLSPQHEPAEEVEVKSGKKGYTIL